ncbi:hypothetical protein BD410DRAFT_787134 [Rickenella mellea]|uniref:Uncharacterized protein n=1 Tax=Rickenella mellea TaxID=50990 RepID=A0A4Y7QAJ6_9AGAM|nr:hypothetical protein BD410DRAFT_787134 [Rickenella mellea]
MAKKTSIRHLLNTTRVPTAAEAETVRQIIEEGYVELWKLRNQATAVKNKLSNLLAKYELTEKRIKAHAAILAPIRRLPQEVLSEIFFYCLPARGDHLKTFSFHEAPLLLCQVCVHWRVIARRTPRLWSTLTISNPSYDNGESFSKGAKAVKLWISESSSRPFSVEIKYKRPDRDLDYYSTYNGYEDGVKRVLGAIENSSHLWTSMIGVAPCCAINQFVRLMNTGKTPLLEELDLTLDGYDQNYFQPLKLNMTNLQMRTIAIRGLSILPTFNEVNLVNLHVLVISNRHSGRKRFSLDNFWECMTHCPSLHELTLSVETSAEYQAPIQTLELPLLKACTLYFDSRVDPGPFLDKLCFPALSTLSIRMSYSPQTDNWPHFAALLDRSKSHLTEIYLCGVPMSEHNLLKCLRNAPHLVSLDVGENSREEGFIMAMINQGHSKCLCPCLESIRLGRCNGVSWQSVKDMILSRWGGLLADEVDRSMRPPGKVLQSVSMYTYDWDYAKMVNSDPDIHQCILDGLNVSEF